MAEDCGIGAWRVEASGASERVAEAALAHPGPALIEAVVDPNEPLLPPKRIEKCASNLDKVLAEGTPGAEQIREALTREPAVTMLKG